MRLPLISVALIAMAAPASATSIKVSDFSPEAYSNAVSGFANAVVENFEDNTERPVADGFRTAVGHFASLGGTGTGATVTESPFANDGTRLALREGEVYGRRSTTGDLTGNETDDMFLDSNDTYGMRWDLSLGGRMFNKVVLTLTDASDVGATLYIMVRDMMVPLSGLADGASKLVEIDFGEAIKRTTIFFANYRQDELVINDGFSVDDITVNEVPLPASSLLLLGGMGGLAAMRRRRKK